MDDAGKPESLFRKFLWKNSGLLCLVTLLTLPIILGVAIGYVIILAVVTSYRKITGKKSRQEKELEAKQKIRIVLGHHLLDSTFSKPVEVRGHQNRSASPSARYGSVNDSKVRLSDDIESDEASENDETTNPETSCKEERNKDYVSEQVTEQLKNDGDLGTNSSGSDQTGRYSSRAASASSEYYSTASEMEEQTIPESLGSSKAVLASPEVQDTSVQASEAPVKPGVNNQGLSVAKKLTTVTQKEEISDISEKPFSLGKLKYNIQYRQDGNQLHVSILRIINLSGPTGHSNPSTYVKVSLLPQRFCWQRTKVVEGIDPVFNETFVISGFSQEKISAYTLLICVINAMSQWQAFYGDHVIGEVYVPLSHVIKCATNEGKAMCGWSEIRPKLAEFSGLTKCGKINLSLCYRPISGRLIVTIKKARDLKCDNKEKFDPYVKLAVYCDGTRVGRGATRVKRKVLNPVFNEKFNFDLTSDQIAYTTVVVKVLNDTDGDRACLGATVVGYESSKNGQEHWLCMMECLSQHVDAWQSLYS